MAYAESKTGKKTVAHLQHSQSEARARRVGQAVQCLKRFFAERPYYKPYPDSKNEGQLCRTIPQEVLITPTNINIVVETTDFHEAMLVVHEEVDKHRRAGKVFIFSGYLDDKKESELYQYLMRELRRLEIPYYYQGGIILLYLWLCEGVEYL